MVLNSLSAFSVTCNVLQVIEFSVKVLSKAADYRKAETGILTEQKDLRDVLQSLNNLNTDLQTSSPQQTASKQHTVEEARLREANNKCLRLSKEFIDFLDHLKLRDRQVPYKSGELLGGRDLGIDRSWRAQFHDVNSIVNIRIRANQRLSGLG